MAEVKDWRQQGDKWYIEILGMLAFGIFIPILLAMIPVALILDFIYDKKKGVR